MNKTLRSARAFIIIFLLWNEITFLNIIAYLADIIYNPLLSIKFHRKFPSITKKLLDTESNHGGGRQIS